MNLKAIDIHCHLDFKDYDKDREEVISQMRERGVGAVTIGTNLENSKKAVAIAEANENIWACIGQHPTENGDFDEKGFEKLAESKKVVAIGECGLDWFRIDLNDEKEKQRQQNLFETQINFALKHDKPLMLHCRNSYRDVLDILEKIKERAGEKLRGNAHFFAGTIEEAKKFLDLGFTISFTGVITFTHEYEELVRFVPNNMIQAETDAPFVAPVPHRGKRNEPSFVLEIIEKMAEIKDKDVDTIQEILLENNKRLFGLNF